MEFDSRNAPFAQVVSPESIALAMGGEVCGNEVRCPTPGHSPRDRGTSIRLAPDAPDGLLVACFNGGNAEALAVKDRLRAAGVLPEWEGRSRELSAHERAAIVNATAEREAERWAGWREAARLAVERLSRAAPASPDHPYLTTKRIAPERLWQAGGALLVPMTDAEGTVWNIQSIDADGVKRFAKGARVKGVFWWAGIAETHVVLSEGVATGAAIRRATGLPVITAMSAGNLPAIARAIVAKRPDLKLTIAADDDPAGHEAARVAAAETGALIALPKEF